VPLAALHPYLQNLQSRKRPDRYNPELFPRRRGKRGKAPRNGHAAFADLLT